MMVSAVAMQEGSLLLRSEIVLFVRALNLSFLVLLISNDSTLLEQLWFPFLSRRQRFVFYFNPVVVNVCESVQCVRAGGLSLSAFCFYFW